MISVQKFTFDANFSLPDSEGNIELYDIRAAREQGEKEGYETGYQAGYLEASQKLEKLLNHVLKDMENLNERFADVQKTVEHEVLETSFVMVQKLFPYFMEQGGFGEIQKVVEKALTERDDEKVYTIFVNDNAFEPLKHKVNEKYDFSAFDRTMEHYSITEHLERTQATYDKLRELEKTAPSLNELERINVRLAEHEKLLRSLKTQKLDLDLHVGRVDLKVEIR